MALPLERTDELSHRAAQRQRRRRRARDHRGHRRRRTRARPWPTATTSGPSQLRDKVREVFEHPDAEVFPVISGTAANSLALAALCPPWGAVLCHETAHILQSECGATSMFGGGAIDARPRWRALPHHAGGDSRRRSTTTRWGDPHHSQPSVLSLTVPTRPRHGVHAAADRRAGGCRPRTRPARSISTAHGSPTRSPRSGCSPADLTWRAGIDALSLGATKNGALSTDAIVCFDPAISEQLVYRVKRAGHVASKMRFQSAQLTRYLTDGLWLRLAGHANAAMTRLADGLRGLDVELLNDPDVNMLFARVDPAAADRMAEAGLLFYRMTDRHDPPGHQLPDHRRRGRRRPVADQDRPRRLTLDAVS